MLSEGQVLNAFRAFCLPVMQDVIKPDPNYCKRKRSDPVCTISDKLARVNGLARFLGRVAPPESDYWFVRCTCDKSAGRWRLPRDGRLYRRTRRNHQRAIRAGVVAEHVQSRSEHPQMRAEHVERPASEDAHSATRVPAP